MNPIAKIVAVVSDLVTPTTVPTAEELRATRIDLGIKRTKAQQAAISKF